MKPGCFFASSYISSSSSSKSSWLRSFTKNCRTDSQLSGRGRPSSPSPGSPLSVVVSSAIARVDAPSSGAREPRAPGSVDTPVRYLDYTDTHASRANGFVSALRDAAAIAGIGHTEFVKDIGRPERTIALEAITAALED